MKNLRNLFGVFLGLSVILMSCSKVDDRNNDKGESAQSIIMNQYLSSTDDDPDFSFLISSVNALPLLEDSLQLDPQIVVQGYYKSKIQSGTLKLNTVSIPFDSPSYYYDFSEVDNGVILGKTNTIGISGGELFDGFTMDEYCLNGMEFHIDGLKNKNEYSINNGFRVVWDVDNNNSSGVIVVLITAEDSQGTIVSSLELFTESDGQANIGNSILSNYSSYSSVSVFVARGVDKFIDFNNKVFRYTVINYSWARVYKL